MMKFIAIVVAVLVCAVVMAQTITVPVHSYVPARELSARDQAFIGSVPEAGGLREACRQMLQANIIHVPIYGKYQAGDSVRYWTAYQVWTAPYRAEVPVQPTLAIPPPPPLEQTLPPSPLELDQPRINLQLVEAPRCVPVCQKELERVGSYVVGRTGSATETPIAVVGFRTTVSRPAVCPPKSPPGETCLPGTPPPPPPPNNPGVNITPNDPSTPAVPGGDSVLPGVGPPAGLPADHGTHDGAGDVNYSPSDPNIADRVGQTTL